MNIKNNKEEPGFIPFPVFIEENSIIHNTLSASVEIYLDLFALEYSQVDAADFLEKTGKRLSRLLALQNEDGSIYSGIRPGESRLAWDMIVASAAAFTGVIAYACSLIEKKADPGRFITFPAYDRLFRSALSAANSLKDKAAAGSQNTGDSLAVVSVCYWAFAELFRLTGCNEWLSICCEFEGRVFELRKMHLGDSEEDVNILTGHSSVKDMSAAAAWALYKAGGAEYYRTQIEILYGAEDEIRIF